VDGPRSRHLCAKLWSVVERPRGAAQAFPRASGEGPWFWLGLHLGRPARQGLGQAGPERPGGGGGAAKTIAFICQKGGTAKTTGAINLAVEAVLAQAAENGADLVIIDTAGRTNDAALAAAKAADLVLVPLQPSLLDLGTVKGTLHIIRMGGGPPALAILTRVKATGSSHEAASQWLKQHNLAVASAMIGERVIYQHAYARGLGVGEAEPNGKAAQEIQQLYMLASQHVDLPTRRKAAA
jgi:cellulose biosynthesis protein BcsQ